MPELTFEDGSVKLSDIELPGILKRMAIRGKVQFDVAEADGASGKIKKFMGWEDSDISLTIELLTDDEDDCYDKLKAVDYYFKNYDVATANPILYSVANRHCQARGIETVYFSGLNSDESDADDVIICTLNFVEDNPPVKDLEKRNIASSGGGSVETPSGETKDPEQTSILVDVANENPA